MAFRDDAAPVKQIRRADLDLEVLVEGLRGNLRVLLAQYDRAKANTKAPLTPAAEASLLKKIARNRYQLWGAWWSWMCGVGAGTVMPGFKPVDGCEQGVHVTVVAANTDAHPHAGSRQPPHNRIDFHSLVAASGVGALLRVPSVRRDPVFQ